MADTTAKPATTRPSRARTTTAKAAAAKPAAKPAEKPTAPVADGRLKVEMVHKADTANYSRFEFPPEFTTSKTLTGSVYAPLGTAQVLVLIVPTEPAS